MKKQIVVFLDIDGTLLDVHQECNNRTLVDVIASLKKSGMHFGLNSNRAQEDILPIIEQFGLNGPFILENGAVILEQVDGIPVLADGLELAIPGKVKEALQYVITKTFFNARLHVEDTVKMIREQKPLVGLHFFMNAFRRYSASIHHRRDGEMSREIAVRLSEELNTYFKQNGWNLIAQSHTHGETVTVEIPGIDKGSALRSLRKQHPDSIFIAIGDGLGELALRDQVDFLYAVSNAVTPLKEIADATATQPMAQGVEELLEEKVRPLLSIDKVAE